MACVTHVTYDITCVALCATADIHAYGLCDPCDMTCVWHCAIADIDAILTKGERDTKALNDKMQQFTDNAMKFTMDGGIENVYDFKDQEDEDNPDINFKALVAHNWVDAGGRRDRKRAVNYAEQSGKANKGERGGRPFKVPQLPDYQFFNTKRIVEVGKLVVL